MTEEAIPGRPIRIVLGKLGLDGHDRGVKVVARALRDAGMEVIYSGLHRSPEEVVAIAVQEDVDIIGISLLSGAHMTLMPRLLAQLRDQGLDGRYAIVCGGVIPDDDVATLLSVGIDAVLGQEMTPDDVVAEIRRLGDERQRRA